MCMLHACMFTHVQLCLPTPVCACGNQRLPSRVSFDHNPPLSFFFLKTEPLAFSYAGRPGRTWIPPVSFPPWRWLFFCRWWRTTLRSSSCAMGTLPMRHLSRSASAFVKVSCCTVQAVFESLDLLTQPPSIGPAL